MRAYGQSEQHRTIVEVHYSYHSSSWYRSCLIILFITNARVFFNFKGIFVMSHIG